MNNLLKEYEDEVNDWFEEVGLEGNPFTLDITPSMFVGYDDQLKKLTYHIEENHKFALITGATGSGKTTLLGLIQNSFGEDFESMYLSKPPNTGEIVDIFMEEYPPSFFQRIFGLNVSLHDLPDYLNKKIGDRLLIMVDEAHEADIETLQWLRTITDQVEKSQLIMAGLPSFDEKLNENLETLKSRITTRIDLTTLSEDEVRELIKKRVRKHGGEGFGPISRECVDEVYERTGGFPREVLKLCDRLLNRAMENGETKIETTGDVTREEEGRDRTPGSKKDLLKELPYKQREIVEVLAGEDELYPSDIAERLGTEGYKTKQHAVRSVNNILRRLIEEDLVERRRKGKGYIYSLNVKTKNLLVES